MAATAAEIPRERDLLSRLAAGTAGVVGAAFLRRLVAELAGALDAEVAFVAELSEHRDGWARTVASAGASAVELPEGSEFELREHQFDGYLAIALRAADGRAIGYMGVISSRTLDPAPTELQALEVFGARAAAELERRRHERALKARADEVAASRARAVQAADDERRRIGRDLHDGAQQRLVVLGQALELAMRDIEADPEKALARLSAAREQTAVASRELRELARGLHPVGLERGLKGALAALAAQSPLPLRIDSVPDRRLTAVVEATVWFLVSEALSNALKHAGATELRIAAVQHGRTLVAEVADNGAGGACITRGTGLQGLAARVESLGGRLTVESPPGQGTRLTATIPLAPWRTSAEPYLEFGHDGDGGRGARKIDELLAGTRTTGVSLAREWELEGGPPRIGQRIPVYDHTGRRHGFVEIVGVAVKPFGEIDPATIDPEPGETDWHEARARAYAECRDEIAALLGEPDWRLTDAEPMVILTYRSVAAAEISGSIR